MIYYVETIEIARYLATGYYLWYTTEFGFFFVYLYNKNPTQEIKKLNITVLTVIFTCLDVILIMPKMSTLPALPY